MDENFKKKKSFRLSFVLKIVLLFALGFMALVAVLATPEEHQIGIIVIASFIVYIVVNVNRKEEIDRSIVIIFDIVLGTICLLKIIKDAKSGAETVAESIFGFLGGLAGTLLMIILLFVLFEIIFSNIKINKEKLSKSLSTFIGLFVALSVYLLASLILGK